MKSFRQAAILELVAHEAIASQEILRQRLRTRGFDATQATISRDIKELGLVKRAVDGAYRLTSTGPPRPAQPWLAVRRAVADHLRRIERVEHLVVLRADPGEANLLALAIDQADFAEVAGTVAGDDTVLVITRTRQAGRELAGRFEAWARR